MTLTKDIVIERIIASTPSDAWTALTELSEMHQWYFDMIPEFKAEVGFDVKFDVQATTQIFPHYWKVVEVIPNQKISYDWHFGDAFPGLGLVTWEIEQSDDGVLVRIIDQVIEPFDDTIPEFKRESGVEGWNYFMDRLVGYLEE